MKKLFVILFVFSFSASLYSQSILLPITVSNNVGKSKILNIGLDPTATDLLDASLGEDELPPAPPEDIFDARINIYNSSMVLQGGSLIDLRSGTNTFLGEKIYYINYQPGMGTTVNIAWELPSGVIGTLQDRVTGNLINQSMKGTSNFTISDPSVFNKVKITITYLLSDLSTPVLSSPANNSLGSDFNPSLSWSAVNYATLYKLIVATDNNFTNIVFQDSTLTTTSKTLSGLDVLKQYYWKVRAKNPDAKYPITEYSSVWNFTTKLIAPVKPILVLPTNNSINQNTSVQLKWRSVKYAATYELIMSEASDFTTSVHTKTAITDTTYTAPAMNYSKTIYWKVRAVNSAGNSDYSDPFNFRTLLSQNVTIAIGWNMVSVPVVLTNMSAASIYLDKVSNVYKFNEGYVTETSLLIGTGYWVKYNAEKSINFIGSSSPTNKVAVKSGWNMIGAFDTQITVSQITTEPANSISTFFYGFTDGYIKATTLDPGKGYWIKVNADGNLVLPTGVGKNSDYTKEYEYDEVVGSIYICDEKGKSTALSIVSSGKNLEMAELPPMPPVGIFDVRFSSNRFAEQILPGQCQQILISSADYPVSISVDKITLRVRDSFGNEKIIKKGEKFVITNPAIERIEITSIEIPTEFQLMQNYPNPFNPATTIKFTLPEAVRVRLEVFNILGEKVADLINSEMDAGYHEVNWNARNLSTGVYVYSINAGSYSSIKKMILLK
ncbi:MAG: T9SS type A sorting domain-containing protein [Melioribacteraceae bacterium]